MVKEYIKKRKKFLEDFNKNLPKYKNLLPIKNYSNKNKSINTDSWFDINCQKSHRVVNNVSVVSKFPNEVISSIKVKMILTNQQKLIINKWFEATTKMYNESLTNIRNTCALFNNEIIKKKIQTINKNVYSFYNLRQRMYAIKNELIKESQIESINSDTKIYAHVMDYAIKQLSSNIKSAVTNLKNGNIKKFRIKYWRHNRPSKTIEIEKQYLKNKKVCFPILGNIKYEYNNEEFFLDELNSNVKINYNLITNEYLLLIPEKNIPTQVEDKTRNIIVLDPGLRTFMTGQTENETIKIGTNVNSTLIKYIKRRENIKANKNIPAKIKKKNESTINRKILNKTDDLQWKTINFLTANFTNILLGDMSAKSIVRNNKSVLSSEMKLACLQTRFYEFSTRLKYKCEKTKTNFQIVNEMYTSKTCSLCGNYNDKLKGEKVYNCSKCNCSIDRDINGCRNILIKYMMEK